MKAIQVQVRKHLPAFVLCMLFCIAVYSHLMTEELANPIDAIWHYSYHRGSTWEISNGRWFWYYITQLRFGICTDPLTSLIALACFSAGCVALLELLSVRRKITACLACGLFLGNVVVCNELSYRFMSPTFALAFLMSVLAALVMIRGRGPAIAILGGGVLIALMMGLYQAYLGAACIAVLGWFLWALLREEMSYRELGKIAIRCIAGFCLGGALYLVAVKIHLRIWHIALADRAASYSLMNTIKQLPQSFAKTYSDFFDYFVGDKIAHNAFRRANLPAIAIALSGGGMAFSRNSVGVAA